VKTGHKNIGLAGVILLRISYLMVAITENCYSNVIRRGDIVNKASSLSSIVSHNCNASFNIEFVRTLSTELSSSNHPFPSEQCSICLQQGIQV